MSVRRAITLVLLTLSLGLALAARDARADGDPASDYLLGQKAFLPYDANVPTVDQAKLNALLDEAAKRGYPIRVAVIWSSYDLGSVTALWRKPHLYARFLAAELAFVYKGKLLIVMPNGFGFHDPKKPAATEATLLAKIPIAQTPAGLTEAAITAVQRLAAAHGVSVVPPRHVVTPAQRNNHDRITIVAAVLVALGIGVLLRLLIRWRASDRFSG
jgi:hypothetical protein